MSDLVHKYTFQLKANPKVYFDSRFWDVGTLTFALNILR